MEHKVPRYVETGGAVQVTKYCPVAVPGIGNHGETRNGQGVMRDDPRCLDMSCSNGTLKFTSLEIPGDRCQESCAMGRENHIGLIPGKVR